MSNINPNNIDGQYPIAGQDNDSQGFRDNFTNIKNNLTFAKTELEDLQNKVILKSALLGSTLNNNLNNALLIGAQCRQFTETFNDIGTVSGAIEVNWQTAHFQTLTTNGTITLTFAGWPTSGFYTKLRLWIVVANTAHTLTLPSEVTVNTENIQGASGQVITFPATGNYIFDFTTYDGGSTIVIEDAIHNYQSIVGSLSVSKDLTAAGNLIVSGNVIESGVLYVNAPSTNFNTQANVGISRVIFNPSGTLANGTLTLPAGNVASKVISVSSTETITAFAVKGYGNVTVKPSANVTLTAGTSVSYYYNASTWQWFKV